MFPSWGDFFFLIGSAAAGLIGLLFVVVTLTAGVERSQALRGASLYMSPTVGLFGAALFVSALILAPGLPSWLSTLLLAIVSLGGLGFAVRSYRGISSFRPDAEPPHWSDAWFYGVLPGVVYAGLAGGALALGLHAGCAPLALGMMLLALLFVGIRNAWDLVTWLAPQRSDAPPSDGGTPA
jgi:hypothetical protein